MSDCTHIMLYGIRSFLESSKVLDPHSSKSALPPVTEILCTLYLNIFREEPAISKFDWPFTPYLKSSASIATDVGSVLQKTLRFLQPVQDKIT